MDFFERYCALCAEYGLKPMAHETAKKLKITNATITNWGKRGNKPKGDTLIEMARLFHVSVDYILGLTDVKTDYVHSPDTENQKRLLQAFACLDEADQTEVLQYIDFKAGQEKYKKAGVTA